MKASELIKTLETRITKNGDLEVVMLDDETGTYEPVAAVFLYCSKAGGVGSANVPPKDFVLELATARQAGDNTP